jgi:hypothetical protein
MRRCLLNDVTNKLYSENEKEPKTTGFNDRVAFLKLALACAFTVLYIAKARGGGLCKFWSKLVKERWNFCFEFFKGTVA